MLLADTQTLFRTDNRYSRAVLTSSRQLCREVGVFDERDGTVMLLDPLGGL